jgi:hypothetical protein
MMEDDQLKRVLADLHRLAQAMTCDHGLTGVVTAFKSTATPVEMAEESPT